MKKIEKVISIAQTYLGVPYKYGGMGKDGLDCSALIYNSYRIIGVSLPRTAKEQSKIGSTKGWDGLRPGDIVYFKFKNKGENWYHSGLITYVGKDDIKFIHASSSRGVVQSSLMADYYKKNVKRFKRII
ncbi:MAG: C40 family peptidase [Marinoscillum sp.]